MFRIYSGLVMGVFGLCLAAIVGGMGIGAARQEAGMLVYGDSLLLLDTAMPGAPPFHPLTRYPSLPVWSPDGQSLAAVGVNTGQMSIFSANTRRRATFTADIVMQLPVWSFDGRWIAVTGYPSLDDLGRPRSNDADVWLISADGSVIKNVTRTDNLRERTCLWSSDSRYLACQGIIDDRTTQFFILKLDDGSKTFLSNVVEAGRISWFLWRPGTHQVFVGAGTRIYHYDTDTGEITRQYTDAPLDSAAISPDGQLIAAVVWQAEPVLHIFDLEWQSIQTARPGAAFDTGMVQWSPDGKQIAISTLSGGQSTLYLMEVATGNMTVLYRVPSGSSLRFQWRPHSRTPS